MKQSMTPPKVCRSFDPRNVDPESCMVCGMSKGAHKDPMAPESVRAFIDEIHAVCSKHGLGVAHEDHQGCFIIGLESDCCYDDFLDGAKGDPER